MKSALILIIITITCIKLYKRYFHLAEKKETLNISLIIEHYYQLHYISINVFARRKSIWIIFINDLFNYHCRKTWISME